MLADYEFMTLWSCFAIIRVCWVLENILINILYSKIDLAIESTKYLSTVIDSCTEDKYSCFQKETLNWKCTKPHSTLFGWFSVRLPLQILLAWVRLGLWQRQLIKRSFGRFHIRVPVLKIVCTSVIFNINYLLFNNSSTQIYPSKDHFKTVVSFPLNQKTDDVQQRSVTWPDGKRYAWIIIVDIEIT